MDHRLKQLVEELSAAIGESVSESEEIAEVVAKIKNDGYDVAVVLNAAIAVKERGEGPLSRLTRTNDAISCKFNTDDIRFLKELHIKVNG